MTDIITSTSNLPSVFTEDIVAKVTSTAKVVNKSAKLNLVDKEVKTKDIICYSPEFILSLDKEEVDYPIDPMILAILNGIKKTIISYDNKHPYNNQQGMNQRKSFGNLNKNHNNGLQGPNPHGPFNPNGRVHNNHNNNNHSINNHNGGKRYKNDKNYNNNKEKDIKDIKDLSKENRDILLNRKKLFIEDGDGLLANIKDCLCKLSATNFSTINATLLGYEMDKPDTLNDVAKILHEAAINGVFIVEQYVAIFLSLAKKYPKIVVPLNQRIIKEINEPFMFEDEEDTLTESKAQKVERWQIANIHIFAELYHKGAYKEELMRKTILSLYEKELKSENNNMLPIRLITELLQKITKFYDKKKKNDQEMKEIMAKLLEMSKNKSYPGIIRFPLLNAVNDFMKL